MRNRRIFLAALCVGALTAFAARAFEIQSAAQAAAQKAIASGALVVVEVYASWCPICQDQASAIDSLKNEPVYRGGKEVARAARLGGGNGCSARAFAWLTH